MPALRKALHHILPFLRSLLVVAGVVAPALAAAAAQRTFVASNGNDANTAFNCSIANPCRGFAAAIGVTTTGGEVVVLDSAGYGPVTITKSISIVAPPGVYAGITALSGDGVTVNAPGATVVLRGLSIIGQGGINGVSYSGTASPAGGLLIENCYIDGMSAAGILVTNNTGFSRLNVLVKHSIVHANASGLKLVGNSCSLADFCVIALLLEDSTVINNNAGVDYTLRDNGQSVCSRLNNSFAFNVLDVSPNGSLATCPLM